MTISTVIDSSAVVVRQASLEEIFEVRYAILRPLHPRESAHFDGDDAATTVHVGAFVDNQAIGCATFIQRPLEAETGRQLRGMAILPQWQRKGVGGMLLRLADDLLRQAAPMRMLWCNARVQAVPFYQRSDWEVISDEFIVPDVGPHYRMRKRL